MAASLMRRGPIQPSAGFLSDIAHSTSLPPGAICRQHPRGCHQTWLQGLRQHISKVQTPDNAKPALQLPRLLASWHPAHARLSVPTSHIASLLPYTQGLLRF